MGKKGKRASKAGAAAVKQGPGKARREQAATLRSVEARLDALVAKLGEELLSWVNLSLGVIDLNGLRRVTKDLFASGFGWWVKVGWVRSVRRANPHQQG